MIFEKEDDVKPIEMKIKDKVIVPKPPKIRMSVLQVENI